MSPQHRGSGIMTAHRQTIARNLRKAREATGMNRSEVAARCLLAGYPGLYEQALGRTERGDRDLELGEAMTLAHILDATVADFVADMYAEHRPPLPWHSDAHAEVNPTGCPVYPGADE